MMKLISNQINDRMHNNTERKNITNSITKINTTRIIFQLELLLLWKESRLSLETFDLVKTFLVSITKMQWPMLARENTIKL